MKIIDNFLDEQNFLALKNVLLGSNFSWYLNSIKVKNKTTINAKFNYQFVHAFYTDHAPKSQYIELINPIISALNPSALLRIKANLTPSTDKIIEYDYHRDFETPHRFDGMTAVFYVNTNNGYTIFENGEKVSSVENRMVIFDSNILHTGTTCTDEKVRCVLNFNYYEWKN
jgi:hypothetical protein